MSATDLGTQGGGGGQMPSACHIICQSFRTHVCNMRNTLFNLIVSSYKCNCLAFADENLSITSSKLMHTTMFLFLYQYNQVAKAILSHP